MTKQEFLNGTPFEYKDSVYHFYSNAIHEGHDPACGEWTGQVQVKDNSFVWWRYVIDKRVEGEVLFKDCTVVKNN